MPSMKTALLKIQAITIVVLVLSSCALTQIKDINQSKAEYETALAETTSQLKAKNIDREGAAKIMLAKSMEMAPDDYAIHAYWIKVRDAEADYKSKKIKKKQRDALLKEAADDYEIVAIEMIRKDKSYSGSVQGSGALKFTLDVFSDVLRSLASDPDFLSLVSH